MGSEATHYNVVSGLRQAGLLGESRELARWPEGRPFVVQGNGIFSPYSLGSYASSDQLPGSDHQRLHWRKSILRANSVEPCLRGVWTPLIVVIL